MRQISALVLGLCFLVTPAMAEPVKFARYPHVSQGKLVFSYHGDIWIANENGTEPRAADGPRRARCLPAPLAGWQVGRVHQRAVRQRRRVRRALGRRRTEAAHVRDDPRHGAELDARRQGDHHRDLPRGQPVAESAVRRAGRRRPADAAAHGWRRAGDDQAGRLDDRLQPHGRQLLAQGLQGQPLRRHLDSGSEDAEDHAADRHEPQGLQDLHAGRLSDVGQRRADLLLVGAQRPLQHLADRADRRRAAAGHHASR